jgi:hypothetical protein
MDEENDEVPLPPETMAASFEDDADKSELIDDYNCAPGREDELPQWENEYDKAPYPAEMIAAAFEKQRDEEDNAPSSTFVQIDEDFDEAPLPLETIAASFEDDGDKSDFISACYGAPDREDELTQFETEYDVEAPLPPEMKAAAFEKQRDEEDMLAECDDDDAPCPPVMIAVSYEAMDSDDSVINKNAAEFIDHDTNCQVPGGRIASLHEADESSISFVQDIGQLDERSNNETPATMNNQEVLLGPSLLSDQRRNIGVEDGTFFITSTTQDGNDAIFYASSQGQMEISSPTNQELIPPTRLYGDPYNQSLPLLEATLVEDTPDEPIYDAFPLSDTQGDEPGWLRRNHKAVILGSVLVAIAATITVIVMIASRPTEASIPPIMISTNSTAAPGTIMTSMPAVFISSVSKKPTLTGKN